MRLLDLLSSYSCPNMSLISDGTAGIFHLCACVFVFICVCLRVYVYGCVCVCVFVRVCLCLCLDV